jgi:hypothetical protein
MQYVLGNMLNGGGINPDGLSLDLQFAADKTLTARRGPTPVFIRSSGDNGGTTYFGPLVDFDLLSEIPATGITNGRASWFKSDGGIDITISYTGTRWRAVVVDNGNTDEYLAATGGEWRPDQADWSGVEFSVTTSSTFGIVKAANNEPRFDHTSAGVCRGLLIEESRTNLVRQSGGLSTSPWAGGFGATLSTGFSAPDGSTNAVQITGTSGSRTTQGSFSVTSGQVYTLSVFLKQGTATLGRISFFDGANFFVSTFTWSTLTASGNSGALSYTSTTTDFGNGWYRVTFTFTSTATASNADTAIGLMSTGTIFAWGAQVEAGSFPTSYIPTTTGTLARSADVCSIANTASFWNSDQFTLFGNANFPNPAHDAYAANFSITNGFFGVRRPNTNTATAIIRSLGVNADISLGTFVTGTMRMAVAHSSGQQAAAFNGGSATQASSAFSPSLNPALNIGYSGSAGYINGHIAAIRYYKKRLPNARLAQLTA